jgi:hypothetical protein
MSKCKSLYPAPVVVAYFAGGEHVRMSFRQLAGKPWRFANVTRMVKQIIGDERARVGWRASATRPLAPLGTEPASDLLALHIEHGGQVYREQPVISFAERRAAAAAKRAAARHPDRKRVATPRAATR